MTNKVEELKEEIRSEKERKLREFEEGERKKFEGKNLIKKFNWKIYPNSFYWFLFLIIQKGTKVTLDNFMEWKRKYHEEIGKAEKERLALEKNKLKLTGRQLFERDASLANSDLQFIGKDEDVVAVDESLFQDLDDLDLDDEDDSEFDPDDISDSD